MSSAFGGFAEGQAAYKAGDYATAVSELQPSASQGNASAQYLLGVLYRNGLGVRKDHAESANSFQKRLSWGIAKDRYRWAAERVRYKCGIQKRRRRPTGLSRGSEMVSKGG